jgi:beta-glucosidase
MPPSDFAEVNIDEILDKLTTGEAVKLIAGAGPWNTASVERLGIPAIRVRLLLRRHVRAI